jgi:hypothetical protein
VRNFSKLALGALLEKNCGSKENNFKLLKGVGFGSWTGKLEVGKLLNSVPSYS